MTIHQSYHETSILWWKFITLIKVLQLNENWALWWKLITLMKNRLFDENLLFLWDIINLMKIHYFGGKSHHCNKISSLSLLLWWKITQSDEKWLLWWKLMTKMNSGWKYITMMKIYQFGKNSWLYLNVFQNVENM